MWTVNQIIDDALDELSLPKKEIYELSHNESKKIVNKATFKFVEGDFRPWWHNLKLPYKSQDVDNSGRFNHLLNNLPLDEKECYFIPENEEKTLRVFYGTFQGVIKVLGECSFFEYYLIGKNFDWIMIENDHNELYIIDLGEKS